MNFHLTKWEYALVVISFIMICTGSGIVGLLILYFTLDDLKHHPGFDPLSFITFEKEKKDD